MIAVQTATTDPQPTASQTTQLPAMPSPEKRMQTKDLANAAALVAEAAHSAPDRALTTVQTPYGSADVILDNTGADVILHDRDVTVHVRRK